MSLSAPSARTLRLVSRHISRQQCLLAPRSQHYARSLATRSPSSADNASAETSSSSRVDPITLHRIETQRRAYYKRRSYYASAGFILGMVAIWVTATSVDLPDPTKPTKLDSNRRADDPLVVLGRERKVIVQKLGEEPEERADVVETGTSTVPTFPRVLEFYDDVKELAKAEGSAASETFDKLVEYQLIGLGVRTVSFLGIQVYVVGMYVATEDIAALQSTLIKKIEPTASALVAGEKEKLRAKLLDPEESGEIWSELLKDSGVKTLIRIVPTRNTDFHHLRDAWVRCLTGKAQANKQEFGDEAFGAAVNEFKTLFNRGSVPKQKELLLSRDQKGKLAVWYDDGKNGAQRLGQVVDERISRVVWLNYLAGKSVASEPARKSIIDGVMEFVERPVGTVATRVQLQSHV